MPYLPHHNHGQKATPRVCTLPPLSQASRKSLISQAVPDVKRRLRLSLNSRYDKMIETMRLTRIYPTNKIRKKTSGRSVTIQPGYASERRFMRSSGCLEENFVCPTDTILNDLRSTQGSEDLPCEDFSIPYSPAGKDPLPGWLAQTFATLPQGHPLRVSLSPVTGSPSDTHLSSDFTVIEMPGMTTESEQPIAFSNVDNGSGSPTLVLYDLPRISDCSSSSLVDSASCSAPHVAQNPEGIKPFSTPGPASTIFRFSTPPRLAFDSVDLQCLQTPFEYAKSSDRGSLEGLPEAGADSWQCLSPEIDFIISPLTTPANVDSFQDFYSSPDTATTVIFAEEAASFEPENHSKPSLPYHLELTDLDFRWTAFDRKGIFQGAGPRNLGPDEIRSELHSNHSVLGEERTLVDRSPSPDDHFFHFQTVLNTESRS